MGDTAVLNTSALGFELKEDDLTQSLTYVSEKMKSVSGSYSNISGKHSKVMYEYNELMLTFSGKNH